MSHAKLELITFLYSTSRTAQNTLPTNEDDEDFDPKISLLLPFLSNLHNLLRTCQYSAFWALLNGSDEAATG